jgi:hypothetical protein
METLFKLRHLLVLVLMPVSIAFGANITSGQNGELTQDDVKALIERYSGDPTKKFITNTNQSANPAPPPGADTVTASVVLKPNSKNSDAMVGGVIADRVAEDPNALDNLREELMKMGNLERDKNALDFLKDATGKLAQQEHEKNEALGVARSTVRRFTPESMTFFVAIGAVTFNSMWLKAHGDPLAMERHILSLKDPIAHVSFFAFMAANGFYINARTSVMDPITKQQMMRRLSYQGMAIGSLASSIVSDLGHSGKMCIDYWIKGHNDEKSVQSCNEAWQSWTARNKFQQYFPQIISMWAAQAATEVIDSTGRRAFQKITATSIAQKFLNKPFVVNTVQKLIGVDTAIEFYKGSFSIKTIRWIGKLTQFTMFVGVDHFLSQYTYRPLNNVLKPLTFTLDSIAINNYWSAADKINWDDTRIPEANKVVCSVRNPDCLASSLVREIENFSSQMQMWREHLNSDAETDIAGWMELTKKLLNQIDYSYKFYKSFVSNMFETLNIQSRVQSKELNATALEGISGFPFRKLPLYGVGVGSKKTANGMKLEDVYLLSTNEMERKQMEHVKNLVKQAASEKSGLEGASLQKFNSILSQLANSNVSEVAKALIEINQILGINIYEENLRNKKSLYSEEFVGLLKALRTALGNPYPVAYEFAGFSQAFAANSNYESTAIEADYSLWSVSKKYTFNKATDLMTYKIFCGGETSSIDKTSTATNLFGLFNTKREINWLAPNFDPPSLLKKSKELTEYCSAIRKTRDFYVLSENLYGQKIGDKPMNEFFLQNFNYSSITGDYTKKENANNFEKWWLTYGRQPMDAEFKKYDSQFKQLVEITRQNIFGDKSYFSWFVDRINQSKYLQKNIKSNLQFETNFYLQIISRALDKSKLIPLADKYGYLEKSAQVFENEKFSAISSKADVPEIQKVVDLFNAYIIFVMQDKVDFDKYVAHSKKIDTAINDILVLAGLKMSSKSNPDQVKQEEPLEIIDITGENENKPVANTPSSTGTEVSSITYKDVEVKNPSLRQKAIVASVKGLRLVESEIRRFIRMKVALSQGLELDTKEFMEDWNNSKSGNSRMTTPAKANPFGQRIGE